MKRPGTVVGLACVLGLFAPMSAQTPLTAAYGEAETAKLQAVTIRTTRARSIRVVAHRPDLSRIPASGTL